jgi:hypothetical protein
VSSREKSCSLCDMPLCAVSYFQHLIGYVPLCSSPPRPLARLANHIYSPKYGDDKARAFVQLLCEKLLTVEDDKVVGAQMHALRLCCREPALATVLSTNKEVPRSLSLSPSLFAVRFMNVTCSCVCVYVCVPVCLLSICACVWSVFACACMSGLCVCVCVCVCI